MVDWLNRLFVLNEDNFYQHTAHLLGSGGLSLFSVKNEAKHEAAKGEEEHQGS